MATSSPLVGSDSSGKQHQSVLTKHYALASKLESPEVGVRFVVRGEMKSSRHFVKSETNCYFYCVVRQLSSRPSVMRTLKWWPVHPLMLSKRACRGPSSGKGLIRVNTEELA